MVVNVRPQQTGSAAGLPPAVSMPLGSRIRALRNIHTDYHRFRDDAGPVAWVSVGPRWLSPPFVILTSARGAHDLLANSHAGGLDKTMLVHRETRILGDNSFNLPYDAWKPRRRTVQPVLTRRHVSGFAGHMATAADEHARGWTPGSTVDLDREMRRLTFDVLGRSLFGIDLDRHSADLAPVISDVMNYVTSRSLRPVRAPSWLPTPARRRARSDAGVLRAVAEEAIARAEAAPRANGHEQDGLSADLVRLLLDATDPETGRRLTHGEVVDELLVFLIAGHDTTSTTLTYALWALGRQPDLQERVRAEAARLGDGALATADAAGLTYTVQVVHEALRLCPPASVVGRYAERDVELAGYRIPAGTNVALSISAVHRDPDVWDRPDEFDPDRFAPGAGAARDRWSFLPFGGGARSCVGDHFAMLEATLGLATIVRRARLTSLQPEFETAMPFTMTAAGPVPARVEAVG